MCNALDLNKLYQHIYQNDYLLREKNNYCIILDNYHFVMIYYINNIIQKPVNIHVNIYNNMHVYVNIMITWMV